jgi:hypothetical protein
MNTKLARLPALCTDPLYLPEKISGTKVSWFLSLPTVCGLGLLTTTFRKCLLAPSSRINCKVTYFSLRLSRPQGHNSAGRIKYTKNPNDPIGNRTHEPSACSTVPQQNAPLSTPPPRPSIIYKNIIFITFLSSVAPHVGCRNFL